MLEFQCECGKALKVDESMAGKLGKCPKCGQTLRVPEPPRPADEIVPPATLQPDPAAEPTTGARMRTGRSRGGHFAAQPEQVRPNTIEIAGGFLMLATIFMPWLVVQDKVWMSWDIVAESSGASIAFLIGAWVIGLVTIIVSFSLKEEMVLWFSYAALGLLGVILFLTASSGQFSAVDSLGPLAALMGSRTVAVFSSILLLALIIVLNLRARIGASPPVRIVQASVGGVLGILCVVSVFTMVARFADLPKPMKARLVLDLIFSILADMGIVLASIFAVGHAAAAKIKGADLSKVALGLVYAALGVSAGYVLIRPAMIFNSAGMVLVFLNYIMLVGPIVVLFCHGAVRSVSELVPILSKLRSTSEATGGDDKQATRSDIEARLHELARLREQEVISEKEYAEARQKALEQM